MDILEAPSANLNSPAVLFHGHNELVPQLRPGIGSWGLG